MRVHDSAESAHYKSPKLYLPDLRQWGPQPEARNIDTNRRHWDLVVPSQLAYIEEVLDRWFGEWPIELCLHDIVTGLSYWPIERAQDWESVEWFLHRESSRCFISFKWRDRKRWHPLKVGWWTPDDVLQKLACVGLTQRGGVDWGAAAELLRDPSALKRKFIRIWLVINSGPTIKDEGGSLRSDKSDVWWRQAKMMRKAGASNEEMAALLTLCRKTFAVRFPRGLNDKRARKEIERLCSKTRKKG